MQKDFFRVVSRQRFLELLEAFGTLGAQRLRLEAGYGRRLARDVVAPEDLPRLNRSCMDGFAVRARDVFGAGEGNPAYLELQGEIPIGRVVAETIEPGRCFAVVTGSCLPPGADAVVMVEHAEELGGGTVEIRKAAAPGDHVMLQGEDAQAGQVVLAAGALLRAQEIGLLAALGITEFEVVRRPRLGLLSTGDELVPAEAPAPPGRVRDVNSPALACLLAEAGAEVAAYGLVPDEPAALQAALRRAVEENDAVFVSGGSSVGTRDFTLAAIAALPAAQVLCHGVAISPGKPTILARSGDKAVWGLPGQITSAQVVLRVLGWPFLGRLGGDPGALVREPRGVLAELSRNVASKQGREDYVRVRLEERPGALPLAHPVLGKSGLLKTLLLADGLIRIPADLEGLEAHAAVTVRPV